MVESVNKKEILTLRVEGLSQQAIADKLGISRRQVRNVLDDEKIDEFVENVEEIESLESDLTIFKLKNELNDLRKKLKSTQREILDERFVREEIFNLSEKDFIIPEWISPSYIGAGNKQVPILFLSDIHYAEVVSKEETGGLNEYNINIANRRLDTTIARTIDIAKHHSTNTEYEGIVVVLGGDALSGCIHEELTTTNEITMPEAVVKLAEKLSSILLELADEFGKVFVPAVVGNHARLSHKPQAKNRTFNNYEWLMFHLLKSKLSYDNRISIVIPNQTDIHFKVFSHRYLLTHGDSLGTSGGNGIIGCIGPIMRGYQKLLTSESQVGNNFDTLLLGHYHTQLWLPGVIVNGTTKGADEYSRLFMRVPYAPPTQALWFNNQHRITSKWDVSCDSLNMQNDGSDWISWKR